MGSHCAGQRHQADASHNAVELLLGELPNQCVDQRLRTLEVSTTPSLAEEASLARSADGSGRSASLLQAWCEDMQRRVEALEGQRGGGSDTGESLRNILAHFDKQHNDAQCRFLETERRLSILEGVDSDAGAAVAIRAHDVDDFPVAEERSDDSPVEADVTVSVDPIVRTATCTERAPAQIGEGSECAGGGGGGTSESMETLEELVQQMQAGMEYLEKRLMQSDKLSKDHCTLVVKSVEALAQWMSGGDGDGSRAETKASSTADWGDVQGLKHVDFEHAIAGRSNA